MSFFTSYLPAGGEAESVKIESSAKHSFYHFPYRLRACLGEAEFTLIRTGEAGWAMSIVSPDAPVYISTAISRQRLLSFIFRQDETRLRRSMMSSEERIIIMHLGEIQYVTIVFFFRNIYLAFINFLGF